MTEKLKKQKITLTVTETRFHKVVLELPEDEMNALIEELEDSNCHDLAGDMCDSRSLEDGEWELEDFEVEDLDDD